MHLILFPVVSVLINYRLHIFVILIVLFKKYNFISSFPIIMNFIVYLNPLFGTEGKILNLSSFVSLLISMVNFQLVIIGNCGVLSENRPHRLICLNTYSQTDGNWLGRIGRCGLVEGGVSLRVGFEISKFTPFPVSSLSLLPSYICSAIMDSPSETVSPK